MEANFNGTTIKPNTTVSISRGAVVKPEGVKPVQEARVEATHEPEAKIQKPDQKPVSAPENKNQNVILAERLTEKAKKDGVDEALLELARLDLEEKKDTKTVEVEESKKQEVAEKNESQENSEQAKLASTKDNGVEVADRQLYAQIEVMQQRVENLSKENEDLRKRMAEINEMNKQALMTAMQLAEVLKQLIEEEEDKDKKTFLEQLLRMWAYIISRMVVSEEAAKKEEDQEEDEDKSPLEQLMAA